ncbi:MAG: head-tail adaptor protein [Isosphaeraceae bacterium]
MRAGELRFRVAIQRRQVAVDGYGQDFGDYPTIGTRWGGVLYQSALERVVGDQARAQALVGIRFRGRLGLDVRPGDRLVIGGRTIEVEQVINPDNLGIEIVCVGKERQAP